MGGWSNVGSCQHGGEIYRDAGRKKSERDCRGEQNGGGSLSKYPVVWKLASCHQSVCEGKRRGKAMGREESACRDCVSVRECFEHCGESGGEKDRSERWRERSCYPLLVSKWSSNWGTMFCLKGKRVYITGNVFVPLWCKCGTFPRLSSTKKCSALSTFYVWKIICQSGFLHTISFLVCLSVKETLVLSLFNHFFHCSFSSLVQGRPTSLLCAFWSPLYSLLTTRNRKMIPVLNFSMQCARSSLCCVFSRCIFDMWSVLWVCCLQQQLAEQQLLSCCPAEWSHVFCYWPVKVKWDCKM